MTFGVKLNQQQIVEFCQRWGIVELGIFGSALGEAFTPESDIDLLVRFAPERGTSLTDRLNMIEELERLLGHPVDLVVEASLKNPFRRKEILRTRQVLYRAA